MGLSEGALMKPPLGGIPVFVSYSSRKEKKMKTKFLLSFVPLALLISLMFINISRAADYPIISTEELKAKLDAGTKLFLVYPLSDIEFNQGHIPGSTNIPLPEIKAPGKLPENKETLIVMY